MTTTPGAPTPDAGPSIGHGGRNAGDAASTTSVLVVDDNPVIRMGLTSLLSTDAGVAVVGEAADGDEALQRAAALRPDVVLLDVRMPRRDGVSVVRDLSEHSAVVMLTFTEEPGVIREAIANGACGYLVHGAFDAASLAGVVRAAAQGGGSFSGVALEALRPQPAGLGAHSGGPRPQLSGQDSRATPRGLGAAAQVHPPVGLREGDHGLSARQAEVMEAIAAGRTNGQIAREFFLSEKTVKNHINQIFARLGVSTRAEAMAVWLGTAGR